MSRSVRCAIYTRKSTEEGLDQAFNSLDAQREACEAYVRSQTGEGWKLLVDRYDDGGFSGGNLDRPGMQRLLADIDAGKVDVIVVYKVDRLTRSLLDFARVVERLDARGVSFVSVTQAFNTTTSMGRLTLNVLLSFAQFEREVTGERIRDKIAASKAKGMWMGGNLPLGYDLGDRRLVVNAVEAEQVRHIFSRYLELGSGVALMKELRRDGFVSKRWTSRAGQERGGTPFSCGAVYYLLQNRLYLGEITHRGSSHLGEHEAVVPQKLFDAVQEALARRRQKRRDQPKRAEAFMLAGLVVDANGRNMTTSFSYGRSGRRYRYYVSGSLDPSALAPNSKPVRYPASPLERLVVETFSRLLQRPAAFDEILPMIGSVELRDRSIQLILKPEAFAEPCESPEAVAARLARLVEPARVHQVGIVIRVVIHRQPRFRGGKVDCHLQANSGGDAALALRSAHRLLDRHSMSPSEPTKHCCATAPRWQRDRKLMALGLLAPKLQKRLLQGLSRAPIASLVDAPLAWVDQMDSLEGII